MRSPRQWVDCATKKAPAEAGAFRERGVNHLVVATVGFNPNETYAQLVFSNPQPNPNVGVHLARQEEAREMLAREPDVSGFVKLAPAPARGAKVARR